MSTVDLNCKLLCASESSYLIQTYYPEGVYQLNLINPTTLPPKMQKPKISAGSIKQYNAVGFIGDPYVVVSAQIEACLVGKTAECIVVAFRGTLPMAETRDSFLDWMENILLGNPESNFNLPGKVHSGFFLALFLLAPDVKKAIDALDPNHNLPLHFTGHSKGGAIAPIAAMYFKSLYSITATDVITFAGPKPGNGDFAKAFNQAYPNHINYENYLDIVPFLPPSDAFIKLLEEIPFLPRTLKKILKDASTWDYVPLGTTKYIDKDGHVNPNPPSNDKRLELIAKWLFLDHKKISNAHHVTCGFRYMSGTCTGNVCS